MHNSAKVCMRGGIMQRVLQRSLCRVVASIWHARKGAADLIASRIPPGRIDWVVGGWVVFFVFVVSLFFLSSLGWLLFCCVAVPTTQQPNNLTTQQPSNPTTKQPNNPTTQQHNIPRTTTQEPNNPRTQEPCNNTITKQPNNPTSQTFIFFLCGLHASIASKGSVPTKQAAKQQSRKAAEQQSKKQPKKQPKSTQNGLGGYPNRPKIELKSRKMR